jgi:glucose-1-phosphate cytidylyltransferase
MKAVILAGGMGTRISEESHLRPKPMIEIGGKPILWHIMKIYSAHGVNDFVVCSGYKGYVIKEYFANFALHASDVTFDLRDNSVQVHENMAEPWRVTVVDTGDTTQTGGRIKRIRRYIGDEDFCLTYGDAVGDFDVQGAIALLREQEGALAVVTAVQPLARFGELTLEGSRVTRFLEKPQGRQHEWLNGGFFVLSPRVFDYIQGDDTVWEHQPLQRLAAEGKLRAFLHRGFWQPMDTLREKNLLEQLWASGTAPWKTWK